jgi:riboflavin biosynthesis pyrimidine reductase
VVSAPRLAEPLVALYERPELRARPLPAALTALYGGDLDFPNPCLFANFVSSIDGVAALGPHYPSSGSTISGHSPADRFVMALLRSCAHAVVIGAGALRTSTDQRWLPGDVCPDAAAEFAELRTSRGLPAEPELVVLTTTGNLPVEHAALKAGAIIATTTSGAARLAGRIPPTCTLLSLGDGPAVRPNVLVAALHERGLTSILSEAGPSLAGQLVEAAVLDELFLTVSPVLAGRDHTVRDGLLSGLELLPEHHEGAELLSVHRQASYLFLRYRLADRGSDRLSDRLSDRDSDLRR